VVQGRQRTVFGRRQYRDFRRWPLEDRACPPARAQADDELVAALSEAATWKRQGDLVSFIEPGRCGSGSIPTKAFSSEVVARFA